MHNIKFIMWKIMRDIYSKHGVSKSRFKSHIMLSLLMK